MEVSTELVHMYNVLILTMVTCTCVIGLSIGIFTLYFTRFLNVFVNVHHFKWKAIAEDMMDEVIDDIDDYL